MKSEGEARGNLVGTEIYILRKFACQRVIAMANVQATKGKETNERIRRAITTIMGIVGVSNASKRRFVVVPNHLGLRSYI